MFKPLKSQLIINKARFRSREEDITVYVVFKVFIEIVSTFKRDYRRDIKTTYRDTFYQSKKLLIIRIIDISSCVVSRDNNK